MHQYNIICLFLLFSLPLFSMEKEEMEVKGLDFNQATQLLVKQAKLYWQDPIAKNDAYKKFKMILKENDSMLRRNAVDQVLDLPADEHATVFDCLLVYGGKYAEEEIGHLHAMNTPIAQFIKKTITERNVQKMHVFLNRKDILAAKTFLLTDNLLLDCRLGMVDTSRAFVASLWDSSCKCGDLDIFNSLMERATRKDMVPAIVALKKQHKMDWLKILVDKCQDHVSDKRIDMWRALIPNQWQEYSEKELSNEREVFETAISLLFPQIHDAFAPGIFGHVVYRNCIPAVQVLIEPIKMLDVQTRAIILNAALNNVSSEIPCQVKNIGLQKIKTIICLLLSAGADINSADENGNTLLHRYGRYYRETEMIEFLLQCGARKDLLNNAKLLPQDCVRHDDV